MRTCTVCLALSIALNAAVGQSLQFGVSNLSVSLSATIGKPLNSVASIGIGASIPGDPIPKTVKFKYTGVTLANPNHPMPPNFVVVWPPSGTTLESTTTSFGIRIGLNESVLRTMSPGTYSLFVNFSTLDLPEPLHTGLRVDLHLSYKGPPVIRAAVNSADRLPGLSPGALVSIIGENFGPPVFSTTYDDTATYPTSIDGGEVYGDTTVQFDGIPAPLLYLSPTQIDALVPYGVAGQESAEVIVTCYRQSSEAITVPIRDTSPAIFTSTTTGSGQGAILHRDPVTGGFVENSADNPAERGADMYVFATGFGVYDPPVPDGTLNLTFMNPGCVPFSAGSTPECRRLVAEPITLTIGGKEARIVHVRPPRYQTYGRLEVYTRVPEDVEPGVQPVVLTVGQNDNAQQQVTMVIK